MNNTELFDRYINGQLSQKEVAGFEEKLAKNSAFSLEFRLHLLAVHGIQKEEEEDCIEFGHAIKSLTKEELNEIIDKRTKSKIRHIDFQKYLWPLSTVATIIIAFTLCWNMPSANVETANVEQELIEARNNADNILYAYNEPMFSSRGGETIDISGCTDEELKNLLPKLQNIYDNSESVQDTFVNGKALAMVYIKLHNREKAKEIIESLINKHESEEDFAEAVAELRMILNHLKK